MFFKILKKDLKRKKSMNLILLIFIMLATMFISASLNNLMVVLGGVDNYLKQAQIGDFTIFSMGGTPQEISPNDLAIEEFLLENEEVESFEVGDYLIPARNLILCPDGEEILASTTLMVTSVESSHQVFFDEENREITAVKPGEIYLHRTLMLDNDLQEGDILTIILADGEKQQFVVKGYHKDALLGSEMMGNKRFLISEEDYQEMKDRSDMVYGHVYSIELHNIEKFERAYSDATFNVLFGETFQGMKMVYVMDMVIAAIFLMISICLVLISAVMLRFTIIFTVNEDFREIGIMKAIGMKDTGIRKLYVVKYLFLAALGALIGCVASIPVSRMLLAQITKNILLENQNGNMLLTVGVSILIAGVVVLCAYLSTGRIRKFTPMDAIRSGNNGERFRKKGIMKLSGSRMAPTTFMALNDVLSELKKYIVLLITSAIGVWLIVMPINTINTLRSEKIIPWFGITDSDFMIVDDDRFSKLLAGGDRDAFYEYLEEVEEVLTQNGIETTRISTEGVLRYRVRNGEYVVNSMALQGLGTQIEDYFYDEGTPPVHANEVAITHIIAAKLHAGIGDTIYINTADEEQAYIVTAIYQSMNNMGEGIRFTEEAEIDYHAVMGSFGVQVTLKEDASKQEIKDAIEQVQKLYPDAKVQTMVEFIDGMIGGISEQIASLKGFIIGIVLCVNMLVVMLMQKMFLIREQGEMGMLKAIGFSNGKIIGWQSKRIAFVLFFGVLLGTLTGTWFSQLTSGAVFKMMGASRIEFAIKPLEVYVLYPVAIFVTTLLACVVTMLKVRKINVQHMNEIE